MLASMCLHGKGGSGAVGYGEKDHWACIWLLAEVSAGGLQFVSGSRGLDGTQEV